jgi:hypothetical protein
VRRPLYSSSLGRWVQYAGQLQPLRDALGGTVRRYEERLEAALTAYSNTSGQMSPQGRAVYEAVTGGRAGGRSGQAGAVRGRVPDQLRDWRMLTLPPGWAMWTRLDLQQY